MSDREQLKGYIAPEVAEKFRALVIEVDGQLYGNLSKHLEHAIEEYLDNDRYARLESKLDEALGNERGVFGDESEKRKKKHRKASVTEQRTHEIAHVLKQVAGEAPSVHKSVVEEAIGEVAGSSAPTLRDYKGRLKSRRLAFESVRPTYDLWYVEPRPFVQEVYEFSETTGGELMDLLDGYGPAAFDWFDTVLEEIQADKRDRAIQ